MPKEETDIWGSFLANTSKRVQNEHGTCVMIGDKQSGKTDLLLKLCADKNLSMQAEEEEEGELAVKNELALAQKELLSYDYFYIDDDDDTTDDSRVNVWCFNDHMFEHGFDIVGKDAMKDERFLFVICVDLDKPESCVDSLNKWLYKAAAYFKKYFAEFPEHAEERKKHAVNYVKNARESKGLGENLCEDQIDLMSMASSDPADEEEKGEGEEKGAEEGEGETEVDEEQVANDAKQKEMDAASKLEEDIKFDFIRKFYGVPIVVVACKSDCVVMDELKGARELQGKIRSMCLDVGAALVYCSTYIDTNLPQLKKYIEHRLYPENTLLQVQQGELMMEDKVNETFIPAGYDTCDLIKYSTGVTDSQNKFRVNFDESKINEIIDTADRSETLAVDTLDIESEQAWLTGLYQFVTKVSGGELLADMPAGNGEKVEAAEDKEDAPSAESTKPAASRRSSTVKAGATSSDNVGDFFKNLLQAPLKK